MQRVVVILLFFILTGNISLEKGDRMFFTSSFRPDKFNSKSKILINFKDSIPDDSLTIYFSNTSCPEAFSRNIHTAVCIDSLCRLVDITLYWEVTGKYLGYSLPQGEEMTKKEHTPFSENDYNKLTEILSDSSSQLGFYTPEEIHPVKQPVVKTDGITGATPPDLASWIVPEAAYSSYTLWHLTYGATRDSIMAYTKTKLISKQLLNNFLLNSDPYNQVKALQWISETNQACVQFIDPALHILHAGNFHACGQALRFLKKSGINEEQLQKEVIKMLDSEDFRIKNLAIEYFRSSDKLTPFIAREMMTLLNSDNYYLVNVILSLLEKKYQPDHVDQLNLCLILESKNVSVANRVYNFLLNLPDQTTELRKALNRYQKKRQ
jgi:hypothetical protein